MAFSREQLPDTLNGVMLAGLVATAATYIAHMPVMATLGLSPLIVAIFLGMAYANTLRCRMPVEWIPGLQFSAKTLLRTAIVLYGFKLTFDSVLGLGWEVLVFDLAVVLSTLGLAWVIGRRLMGLDRDTCLLIGAGAGICGAAAVMATESTLRSAPHKAVMAVGTVVAFGTLFMVLLPLGYSQGWIDLTPRQFGILTGATVHEVAQVVVVGDAAGPEAGDTAVLTKMGRVLLLAPVLILLGLMLARLRIDDEASEQGATGKSGKPPIPWFVVMFLGVVGVHSLGIVPTPVVDALIDVDTFLLTTAMAALGIETTLEKLQKAGPCPVVLALLLAAWLGVAGYFAVKAFF